MKLGGEQRAVRTFIIYISLYIIYILWDCTHILYIMQYIIYSAIYMCVVCVCNLKEYINKTHLKVLMSQSLFWYEKCRFWSWSTELLTHILSNLLDSPRNSETEYLCLSSGATMWVGLGWEEVSKVCTFIVSAFGKYTTYWRVLKRGLRFLWKC